jgi:hypothetical protein
MPIVSEAASKSFAKTIKVSRKVRYASEAHRPPETANSLDGMFVLPSRDARALDTSGSLVAQC